MAHTCLSQRGKGKGWEQNQQPHPSELGIAGEYAPGDTAVFLHKAVWPGYSLKSFIFATNIDVHDIFNKNRKRTGLDA